MAGEVALGALQLDDARAGVGQLAAGHAARRRPGRARGRGCRRAVWSYGVASGVVVSSLSPLFRGRGLGPPRLSLPRPSPTLSRAEKHGRGEGHSRPRRARLRIRAPVPNCQGGASVESVMRLARTPELRRGDGRHVALLVREALALGAAVLDRREHGAEVEHGAVGILVVRGRASARRDRPDRGRSRDMDELPVEREAVLALDLQAHLDAAHGVEREGAVEQADEGADGGRGVVVLGLGQQQRRAALDVAQVDVVAERGADDARPWRSPPARPPARGCSRWRSGAGPPPCRGRPRTSAGPW